MKDLRSQLANAFGRAPEPAAPGPVSESADVLGPDAHLTDPWLDLLRTVHASVPGAPKLAERPKLGQARQVSDFLLRSLKRSGRKRAAKELAQLRKAFDSRREKEAWSRVKARFADLDLSEKAYRSLKQGEVEALVVWANMGKLSDEELRALGATRLREALGG